MICDIGFHITRCGFRSCAYVSVGHTVNQSHCFGLPLSEQRRDLRAAAVQQILKTAQQTFISFMHFIHFSGPPDPHWAAGTR